MCLDKFYMVIERGFSENEMETHCWKHSKKHIKISSLAKRKHAENLKTSLFSVGIIQLVLTSDWRRFWFKGFWPTLSVFKEPEASLILYKVTTVCSKIIFFNFLINYSISVMLTSVAVSNASSSPPVDSAGTSARDPPPSSLKYFCTSLSLLKLSANAQFFCIKFFF